MQFGTPNNMSDRHNCWIKNDFLKSYFFVIMKLDDQVF
ncbi:Uncharacterized protein dnm_042140 [Desulfonema magnum]|uniref:Uncharacterized protein n=1 Tax=Desulfonema magnum TaxID=45655 RepID=A0A975BM13_9BACT|nr:Uncharacterized protein dnm_042140 [Desulfonema magnum]